MCFPFPHIDVQFIFPLIFTVDLERATSTLAGWRSGAPTSTIKLYKTHRFPIKFVIFLKKYSFLKVRLLDYSTLVPERITYYGKVWYHLAR